MPGRRFVGIFAVVQEVPCPVFISDAYVDAGWREIKFSGADDELVLTLRWPPSTYPSPVSPNIQPALQ